jgi:hypothetical protein
MAVPTVSWSETTPAGSDSLNQGDNRIRELKTQIREVIDVDHDFPSSGQANDVGQHKKCTFQEQADLGTGAVNATILGSQTVSGKGELVYSDEDNNDIQITSGGKIKAESIAGVYPAANVAAIANIMGLIYPVGSYYFNESNSTNPGTLLGVGTWVAVEETVLVGYKSGDADFGTAGATGGVRTVTLTAAQSGVPAHTHNETYSSSADGGTTKPASAQAQADTVFATDANTPANAAEAHTNLQPYRTVYMWRRTV